MNYYIIDKYTKRKKVTVLSSKITKRRIVVLEKNTCISIVKTFFLNTYFFVELQTYLKASVLV